MYEGWVKDPALAPRPSMIYCVYGLTLILTMNWMLRQLMINRLEWEVLCSQRTLFVQTTISVLALQGD
jgi:hypothetical protein